MTNEGASPPTVGAILAGGLARRLGGGDKALRKVGNRTVLAWLIDRLAPQVTRVILNVNADPGRFGASRTAYRRRQPAGSSGTARRRARGAGLECRCCPRHRMGGDGSRRCPFHSPRSGCAAAWRARPRPCDSAAPPVPGGRHAVVALAMFLARPFVLCSLDREGTHNPSGLSGRRGHIGHGVATVGASATAASVVSSRKVNVSCR